MSIELKIPEVGESVREVQIGRWLKREGDTVALDENVVELETDKASMELPAPAAVPVEEEAATKAEAAPAHEAHKEHKHNGDVAVTPAARRALREFGLK